MDNMTWKRGKSSFSICNFVPKSHVIGDRRRGFTRPRVWITRHWSRSVYRDPDAYSRPSPNCESTRLISPGLLALSATAGFSVTTCMRNDV